MPTPQKRLKPVPGTAKQLPGPQRTRPMPSNSRTSGFPGALAAATGNARLLGPLPGDAGNGVRTIVNNTQQQRAFQPNAGVFGQSRATVSPSGRATVEGGLSPQRLAELGVVPSTQYVGAGPGAPPEDRDRTQMHLRQAANRQRMENKLLARRMGMVPEEGFGEPVQAGTAIDDIMERLGMAQEQGQGLMAQQTQMNRQRRGLPSFLEQQPQVSESGNTPPDEETMRRNQFNQVYGSLIAAGKDPAVARQEAGAVRDEMFPMEGASRVNAVSGQDMMVARALVKGMDLVTAERTLVENGYGEELIEKILADMEKGLTPEQRERASETIKRNQDRRVSVPANRVGGSAWNRRHLPTRPGDTGFYAGMP